MRNWWRLTGLAVVIGLVAGAFVAVRWVQSSPPVIVASCAVGSGADRIVIDPDQALNASTVAAVAEKRGLADHAVTIALAAALQESKLRNLTYGDRDSLGLFQQRPSQGWGTPAQLVNPRYAAGAFYAQLVQVPKWETLSVTVAAQRVQRSAAPSAYARWEPEARALAQALTGEVPKGLTCRFRPTSRGLAPGSLESTLQAELGTPGLGVPLTAAHGWTVASWLVAHADGFGIDRVSFAGWQWTAASGQWRSHGPASAQVGVHRVAAAAKA